MRSRKKRNVIETKKVVKNDKKYTK